MIEFANITDLQAIKIFFYIESVILLIAIAIIGFFLRRRDTASIAREIAATAATEGLTTVVDQLRLVVTSLKIQYEIRQPIIEAQIELLRQTFISHDTIIKEIDNRVIKIETLNEILISKYQANFKTNKNDLIN